MEEIRISNFFDVRMRSEFRSILQKSRLHKDDNLSWLQERFCFVILTFLMPNRGISFKMNCFCWSWMWPLQQASRIKLRQWNGMLNKNPKCSSKQCVLIACWHMRNIWRCGGHRRGTQINTLPQPRDRLADRRRRSTSNGLPHTLGSLRNARQHDACKVVDLHRA